MSFMLALPKISLHGAGAIEDMVKLVANKAWGKRLSSPTDNWLNSACSIASLPHWIRISFHTSCLMTFFRTPPKRWCSAASQSGAMRNATT